MFDTKANRNSLIEMLDISYTEDIISMRIAEFDTATLDRIAIKCSVELLERMLVAQDQEEKKYG